MSTRETEMLARRFEEAFNTGDTADAGEFIAPGFVQHGPGTPPVPPGPEGFRELVRATRTAFPDLHLTIEDVIACDDKAAVRYRVRGTLQGEFAGIPPTGRQVETTGTDVVHVAQGKIAEAWVVFDTLDFAEQVGAVQRVQAAAPAGQR